MELSSSDLGLAARVHQLTKTYGAGESIVRALDGVTVGIRRGEEGAGHQNAALVRMRPAITTAPRAIPTA